MEFGSLSSAAPSSVGNPRNHSRKMEMMSPSTSRPRSRRRFAQRFLSTACAAIVSLNSQISAQDGSSSAPVGLMGVDIGNEYMEISLIKDRKFDICLNIESQRKSPAAVSFAGKVRVFGDHALASQNRNQLGAFSYFNRLLGQSYGKCDKAKDCFQVLELFGFILPSNISA